MNKVLDTPELVGAMVNGKLDGICKSLYNGSIHMTSYVNGEKHGMHIAVSCNDMNNWKLQDVHFKEDKFEEKGLYFRNQKHLLWKTTKNDTIYMYGKAIHPPVATRGVRSMGGRIRGLSYQETSHKYEITETDDSYHVKIWCSETPTEGVIPLHDNTYKKL